MVEVQSEFNVFFWVVDHALKWKDVLDSAMYDKNVVAALSAYDNLLSWLGPLLKENDLQDALKAGENIEKQIYTQPQDSAPDSQSFKDSMALKNHQAYQALKKARLDLMIAGKARGIWERKGPNPLHLGVSQT